MVQSPVWSWVYTCMHSWCRGEFFNAFLRVQWRLKVKSNLVKPMSFSTAIVGDRWKEYFVVSLGHLRAVLAPYFFMVIGHLNGWNPWKFLKLTEYLVIASPLFDAKLLPLVDCSRDLVIWRQDMLRELHDSWWTEVGSEESDPAGQQPSIAQTEACTQPHTCMDNISRRGKHMMNIGKSTKPCRLGFAELLEVKASSPWLLELDPNSCNCTYVRYATNSTKTTHTHTTKQPNMA